MTGGAARATRLLAPLVALLLPGGAALLAHAVVFPRESTPGAYEKYVLRVPNERPVPTTRVELAFPPEVRVVSFAEVPGWRLHVVTGEAQRVTGAVWSGELGVERFVEFPFVAVNPADDTRLVWRAVQTYANGERVSWSGPEGSETPASFTLVREEPGQTFFLPLAVAAAALLLALVSLGLALRRVAE